MEPGAAEWLERYGPWALLVVCFGVIAFLFFRLESARKEHKTEMATLIERLLTAEQKQVAEFRELAARALDVTESLSRRVRKKESPNE